MKKVLIILLSLLMLSSCITTKSLKHQAKSHIADINASIIDGFGYQPGMYLLPDPDQLIFTSFSSK